MRSQTRLLQTVCSVHVNTLSNSQAPALPAVFLLFLTSPFLHPRYAIEGYLFPRPNLPSFP